MIILESNPTPEHRALLESLGIALKGTHKVGICVWEAEGVQIELHDTVIPTAPQVIKVLVEAARAAERAAFRRKLLSDLGRPASVIDAHAPLSRYVPGEG